MSTVVEEYAILPETRAVAPSPPTKLTLEQANKLAEGRPFELIEGRMVFKMADYEHSLSQGLLYAALIAYFKAHPIGRALPELTHRMWPEENLYEWRVPDISIILNEHLELEKRYPTRAPDIAIEIISSGEAWTELFQKARLYFTKGCREVWLIDPYEKSVTAMTPVSRRWVSDLLTSELLPGFQVALKDSFSWPSATE